MTHGGEDTFAGFVVREQQALLRLAFLLAGDRGSAEELVQIALAKTYRHWQRIIRHGEPAAYVRRALVTTYTSWRRRVLHRQQVVASLLEVATPERPDRLDGDRFWQALAALPPRMRAALVLRYHEDLSELQTAQLMGCSKSTVNTQAARGLARLRTVLQIGDRRADGVPAADGIRR